MRTIQVKVGDLQKALETYRTDTTFQLDDGVHDVLGAWAFPDWICLGDGCAITGSGQATVRLSKDATRGVNDVPHGDRSLNPLWVGKGCRIVGVTVDGNQKAFPGWYVPSGIRSKGGQLTVDSVRITGLRGDYKPTGTAASAIEAFGISTYEDDGGNRIEDVEFDGIPADAYFSCVYIGSREGAAKSSVSGIRSVVGRGNWFLLSGGVNIEAWDLYSSGHQIGFYNDTEVTRAVNIAGMDARNVVKAVSLVNKDGTDKVGVALRDCSFGYAGPGPHYALELWDQASNAELGNVSFADCRFTSTKEFYRASVSAPNFSGARFDRCSFPDGAKVHPPRLVI